jgi:hypothetical protein
MEAHVHNWTVELCKKKKKILINRLIPRDLQCATSPLKLEEYERTILLHYNPAVVYHDY